MPFFSPAHDRYDRETYRKTPGHVYMYDVAQWENTIAQNDERKRGNDGYDNEQISE